MLLVVQTKHVHNKCGGGGISRRDPLPSDYEASLLRTWQTDLREWGRRSEPREVKSVQDVHSSQLTGCLSRVFLPAVSPPHPFHPVGAARPRRPTTHGLALSLRVPPPNCRQRGAQFLLGEMTYVFL